MRECYFCAKTEGHDFECPGEGEGWWSGCEEFVSVGVSQGLEARRRELQERVLRYAYGTPVLKYPTIVPWDGV